MSSKLKTCKTCSNQVAKSAKVCPSCGAKLKMGFFYKAIICMFVFTVIGVVLAPTTPKLSEQANQINAAPIKPQLITNDLPDIQKQDNSTFVKVNNSKTEVESTLEEELQILAEESYMKNCNESFKATNGAFYELLRTEQLSIESKGVEKDIKNFKIVKNNYINLMSKQSNLMCSCIKEESKSVLKDMGVSDLDISNKIEFLGIGMKTKSNYFTDDLLGNSIGNTIEKCTSEIQEKLAVEFQEAEQLAAKLMGD